MKIEDKIYSLLDEENSNIPDFHNKKKKKKNITIISITSSLSFLIVCFLLIFIPIKFNNKNGNQPGFNDAVGGEISNTQSYMEQDSNVDTHQTGAIQDTDESIKESQINNPPVPGATTNSEEDNSMAEASPQLSSSNQNCEMICSSLDSSMSEIISISYIESSLEL